MSNFKFDTNVKALRCDRCGKIDCITDHFRDDLSKLVERSKETFEMDGRTWPRLSREEVVSELVSILNKKGGTSNAK